MCWLVLTTFLPLGAQPLDLDTPPDSPLWWPLSDEITAQELRSIYRDKAGHLERYQKAVEAGLVDPIPAGHEDKLKFYYNRQHNPELTPLWRAFSSFASFYTERTPREDLLAFGISPGGVDAIYSISAKLDQEETIMVEELAEEGREFMEIFGRLHEVARAEPAVKEQELGSVARALDPETLRAAIQEEDLRFLADLTGEKPAKLQRLLDVAKSNPPAATAAPNMVLLRELLHDEDWHAFKQFLQARVVSSHGGSVDFAG